LFYVAASVPSTFDKLKARYALLAIVIAWYVQPGSQLVGVSQAHGLEWYWPLLGSHYYAQIIMALFLIGAAYASRLEVGALIGRAPKLPDLPAILTLDLFLFCLRAALIVLIYIPVSYVLPDFAAWWLVWLSEPLVYLDTDGSLPLFANLLSFISLVVLGPIVEELLFRGYLLHRWSRKWGLTTGILLSSAVFGALHADPLGVAIFGIGMCVLYLRTQSLYVPILAHMIYNLTVWVWDLIGVLTEGIGYYRYDVQTFQADWELGAVGALVAVLMVDAYIRWGKFDVPRRLPMI
jgi:membrane protease YdiL (CAAX protease family)